jgi:hypothetical protein
MWHTNKLVLNVYAHVNSMSAYAIIEGISGWTRISPTSSDGVTNVLDILSVSKANGKKVNVYIDSGNQIIAAYNA